MTRELRVSLDHEEHQALDALAADMGRPRDEVVRGALRLLAMTRALHNVHGVMKPVGDPRDG